VGLSLPEEQREAVGRILAEHLPGCEVWAFGSRVTGESHEGSDLDLVVRAPERLPARALERVSAALRDSSLPIEVEVSDWQALPASFHEEIERAHAVLQRGGGPPGASGP
jgi:predicted nucleotidyltransferase